MSVQVRKNLHKSRWFVVSGLVLAATGCIPLDQGGEVWRQSRTMPEWCGSWVIRYPSVAGIPVEQDPDLLIVTTTNSMMIATAKCGENITGSLNYNFKIYDMLAGQVSWLIGYWGSPFLSTGTNWFVCPVSYSASRIVAFEHNERRISKAIHRKTIKGVFTSAGRRPDGDIPKPMLTNLDHAFLTQLFTEGFINTNIVLWEATKRGAGVSP